MFPVLEQFRSRILKKYRKSVKELCPYETKRGILYEPEEFELGNLRHVCKGGKLTVSDAEFQILEMFYKIRNKLAHIKPVDFSFVDFALSKKL